MPTCSNPLWFKGECGCQAEKAAILSLREPQTLGIRPEKPPVQNASRED